jgi:hypothetical protein
MRELIGCAVACLFGLGGCFFDHTSYEPLPDAGHRPPDAHVPPSPKPDAAPPKDRTITATGRVVDWATGAPVAGAVVEVRQAWSAYGERLLATATTGADGRFGPVTGNIGPKTDVFDSAYVAFFVSEGGRAKTISDVTLSCGFSSCDPVDHTIAAPASALGAAWRTALAAGGMADAANRGLIAFQYLEPTSAPAAGVSTLALRSPTTALTPGTEVRFLAADRQTVAPATQATTLASGLALVGIDGIGSAAGPVYLGGSTGPETWTITGCMNNPGFIFLEDKHGMPSSLAAPAGRGDLKYPHGE